MYFIENDFLRVEFNETTGAITGLTNKKTNWNIIKQPLLSLGIEMVVPIEEHRNNRVFSQNQKLCSITKTTDTSIRLLWSSLIGSISGELDITATSNICIEGNRVNFSLNIENNTDYIVEEVYYPCLGGVRPSRPDVDFNCKQINMCGDFNSFTMGNTFNANGGYWGLDYPTQIVNFPEASMLLPFELIEDDNQGIYLGLHEEVPTFFGITHELKPGFSDSKFKVVPKTDTINNLPVGFCINGVQLPFIQPKQRYTLPLVTLAMYQGDWHSGVKTYIDWRKSWFKFKDTPSWITDSDCWMTLHINSSEGCCRYKYSELLNIAKDAKQNGVQVLQLIGWARGGQDGDEPLQSIDPRLGTLQELQQAVKDIENIGIRVLLMCKFKWVDASIPEYDEVIYDFTQRDIFDNNMQFGGYSYQTMTQQIGASRHRGFGLCHSYDKYRDYAASEFKKLLEVGASGILYDELTNASPLCMSKNHNHPAGECSYAGSLKLAQMFYDIGTKYRDDFVMTGEGPSDFLSQYYRVNYIRTTPNHIPVWKFINPEMMFATCLIGFEDINMVNHCVACGYIINYEPYNFKGLASDIKPTTSYTLDVLNVRKALSEYIWTGTFSDTVGATLTKECGDSVYHTVFTNNTNGKKAIVVVNESHDNPAKINIKLDDITETTFDTYALSSEIKMVSSSDFFTLKPLTFMVLVEK